MDKPPHDTLVPQRRGVWKMACDTDDREGESPSPMELRPGRMLHSSATGRRREQTLPEAPGLRQALHSRDDTAGCVGSQARTTSRAAPCRTPSPAPDMHERRGGPGAGPPPPEGMISGL